MAELIAVKDDKNTHGNGGLLADNNTGKLFIAGKKVVYKDSKAEIDGEGHVNSDDAAQGTSSKVYGEGILIHRHNDTRACGAKTIVSGNTKVYSN